MSARILIVDDECPFAEFAKMLVESSGYRGIICLEGRKAADVAAREKPDLILMDLDLMDMDGSDVIERIKSNPATSRIPILACSISRGRAEIQKALDKGAVEFLPKPLRRDHLASRIASAIAGGQGAAGK